MITAIQKAIQTHRSGDLIAAEKIYNEILEANPFDPDANHNIGVLYAQTGRTNDAVSSFSQAILINTKVTQFWHSLYDLASSLSNTVLANEIAFLSTIFGSKFVDVQFDNLAEELKMSGVEEPSNLAKELIIKYRRSGDIEFSFDLASKLTVLYPRSVVLRNFIGVLHTDLNDFCSAITAYNKALELQPNSPEILNNLAMAHRAVDDYESAVACLKQSIELNGQYLQAQYNLANLFCEMGQVGASTKLYTRALEIKPDAYEVYYNFAIALSRLGQKSAAIEKYERCLEINAKFTEAHYNLANLYFATGQITRAVNGYVNAIKLNPKYIPAWNNLKFAIVACHYRFEDFNFEPKFNQELYQDREFCRLAEVNLLRSNCYPRLKQQKYDTALEVFSNTQDEDISFDDLNIKGNSADQFTQKKTFALVHFGRSGTGLLHSLIDSHPQVSTLPSIYLSRFFDENTWNEIGQTSLDQALESFMKRFDYLFDSSSKAPFIERNLNKIYDIGHKEGLTRLGASKNETLTIDKEKFFALMKQEIQEIGVINQKIFFYVLHSVIDKLNGVTGPKNVILYHIHNPDTYTLLNYATQIPDTEFIIMVREPLQSCESWCRSDFENLDYTAVVNKIATMLTTFDLPVLLNHRCLLVRLEDLKLHPEETLKSLAAQLDINFNSSLYEMTVMGKKWWGDPTSPNYTIDGMNAFGLAPISKTVGDFFSANDQKKLKILFYSMRAVCGYLDHNEEECIAFDVLSLEQSIDALFDFELELQERLNLTEKEFKSQGSYSYLRGIMRYNLEVIKMRSSEKYNSIIKI